MLDQLVESKSNAAENSRRSKFLVSISALAIFTLLTMWTVSLFGKDFGMGGDDLSLTTLVAPVPVPDDAPPPKPEPKQEVKPDVDVRKELIASLDQTPKDVPKISTVQNTVKAVRPDRMTMIGNTDSDTGTKVDPSNARQVESGGTNGISPGGGTEPTG